MNRPTDLFPICISLFISALNPAVTKDAKDTTVHVATMPAPAEAKIQAAILLDVSNSMDGLIDQAKTELWDMVKILTRVKCNEASPPIQIALYEYGRPENDSKDGYVKQISPFTNDLDRLYKLLSDLRTHGGDEYCGHVLFNSLTQLNWDSSSLSYKVIFIAGNESFLQGDIPFTKACAEAKKRGVIVNTIYCGDRQKGIGENWDLGAECGSGSFTNIDQDAKEISIPTPYDTALITMKGKLNSTYIPYGDQGSQRLLSMQQNDTFAAADLNDPSKVTSYIVVKSDKTLNNHSDWDLVDAMEKDSSFIDKVEMKTLPDSLKNKTRAQLKEIVLAKSAERKSLRNEITNTTLKQEDFIEKEKAKSNLQDPQTLGSEIRKIIKQQVSRVKMTVD